MLLNGGCLFRQPMTSVTHGCLEVTATPPLLPCMKALWQEVSICGGLDDDNPASKQAPCHAMLQAQTYVLLTRGLSERSPDGMCRALPENGRQYKGTTKSAAEH